MFQRDVGPVSPSFTALAELASRIHPPTSRSSSEWLSSGQSISNLLISNTELDYDDDQDEDILLARRARSGSLSDQDLLHDGEFHSGTEEAGYEVRNSLHYFCRLYHLKLVACLSTSLHRERKLKLQECSHISTTLHF